MQTALICNCSPVLTNGMARCEGQALFKREEGGANDILLLRKPWSLTMKHSHFKLLDTLNTDHYRILKRGATTSSNIDSSSSNKVLFAIKLIGSSDLL